jgi:hypothetical protein
MGGKKELTWREVVTLKMKERQAKGEKPSLKDVVPEAQKMWQAIKNGSDPNYVQGKATFTKRKASTGSTTKTTTRKKGKGKGAAAAAAAAAGGGGGAITAQEIISNCQLCKKCSKKVEKVYGKRASAKKAAAAFSKKSLKGGESGPATVAESSGGNLLKTEAEAQGDIMAGGCVGSCPMGGGGEAEEK